MERGTSGGQHHHNQQHQHHSRHQHVVAVHSYDPYMTSGAADEEHTAGTSSFDNPATKKKPPKLKAIHRSLSMAIDDYAPGGGSPPQMLYDDGLIIEKPLIHRSASPLPVRSAAPPQTLALPAQHLPHPLGGGGGTGSGAVSPALSARQQHHQQYQQHHHQQQQQHQQQHLHTFQHLAAQAAAARHHQHPHQYTHQHEPQHPNMTYRQYQHQHSSSASSPTSHAVSPVLGSGGGNTGSASALASHHYQREGPHQPDIYLVSSSSLGDDVGGGSGLGRGLVRSPLGGSTSPIQFIDVDDMLPPTASATFRTHAAGASNAIHPLKKNLFRRSDTIDVHPSTNFQMKKTHSFHAQQDPAAMEQILLAGGGASALASGASSRRTSSVRGNFLMPGPPAGKEMSRSPSPSRRGCRSHRSFNDPARRPSSKPDSVIDSQARHSSLNDDLIDSLDGRPGSHFPQSNLSLENELFVESRSRSNSHTKMEELGVSMADIVAAQRMRKSSGSFEEPVSAAAVIASYSGTHPPIASNSVKQKREVHPHSRQQSTHSLELDGRPSTSSAASAAAAAHTIQLHSAATAATAAYHFKRGAQQGRSLYLSPNNLEELTVHRPGVLAAAAAFQGTNASASVKQAKALHSASVRLRTYREALSASKKSKSFIGDGSFGAQGASTISDEFELASPHRRNSRPLSTAMPSTSSTNIDEIKRSPRPISASAAAAAFIEEKRPSFERKPSLTYELSDAAFAAQVLRPFHHKLAAGRKGSVTEGPHKLKKKTLSEDTDEDEEADRKRKRIVCIVLTTVLLCLVCASIFVVVVTLTSGQGQSGKKPHSFTRDTPVHYTVRQENERITRENLERARMIKNMTEQTALLAAGALNRPQHATQQPHYQHPQLQQLQVP